MHVYLWTLGRLVEEQEVMSGAGMEISCVCIHALYVNMVDSHIEKQMVRPEGYMCAFLCVCVCMIRSLIEDRKIQHGMCMDILCERMRVT
jgi:hypothetical protein